MAFALLCALSFLVLLYNTKADCGLLNDASADYVDTESEAMLLAMCSGQTDSLSQWEQYQCEFLAPRDGWQKCWPQRRMSECAPGSLKGVMFLYHGFSACPDAYNTIAAQLQSECWHVYQISTIGHGFKYCGDEYDGSTSDQPCTAGRYNETPLPETRAPYVEFVQ